MNGTGQNQTDQTANFFWLIAIVCGAFLALWWLEEKWLVTPVMVLRYYELLFIRQLYVWLTPIALFLHLPAPSLTPINHMIHFIHSIDTSHLSWVDFSRLNTAIGNITRWPSIVILTIGAIFMLMQYGVAKFHNVYNMKTLKVKGQEVWPQITPVLSLDLVKMDIDEGPWAMASPPLKFCTDNNLLVIHHKNNKKEWGLKDKQAYRVFVLQLGLMWKGLDALPIYAKALALVFLARATGNRPLSNKILSQVAASAASGKLDFTDVEVELAKYKGHRIVTWLEKRHVYVYTLLATLLEIARSDGVLASAEFLWLKPVDRKLWFVLNTVGRRTAVAEIAGIYSHWIAEKKFGRGLKTPMVKGAVDALNETLQNILFIDEKEQWRTINAD